MSRPVPESEQHKLPPSVERLAQEAEAALRKLRDECTAFKLTMLAPAAVLAFRDGDSVEARTFGEWCGNTEDMSSVQKVLISMVEQAYPKGFVIALGSFLEDVPERGGE